MKKQTNTNTLAGVFALQSHYPPAFGNFLALEVTQATALTVHDTSSCREGLLRLTALFLVHRRLGFSVSHRLFQATSTRQTWLAL